MNRTQQQQAFIQAVLTAAREGNGRNFCLRARAGSGKTATVIELVDDYVKEFNNHEVTLCAYNAAAAKELRERLEKHGHTNWRTVNASTVHSLGFGLVNFTN